MEEELHPEDDPIIPRGYDCVCAFYVPDYDITFAVVDRIDKKYILYFAKLNKIAERCPIFALRCGVSDFIKFDPYSLGIWNGNTKLLDILLCFVCGGAAINWREICSCQTLTIIKIAHALGIITQKIEPFFIKN